MGFLNKKPAEKKPGSASKPTNKRPAPKKTSAPAASGKAASPSGGKKANKVPFKERMSTKEGRSAFWKGVGRVVAVLVCIGIIVGSIGGVLVSLYLVKATKNDGAVLNLNDLKLSYTSILYARNEETGLWEEYSRLASSAEENRIWVDLGDMSEYLPKAFVAVEDKTFYKHGGVNWKRSFAALANAVLRKVGLGLFGSLQGGSTITQQLVKNVTGDDDQTAGRKLREMFRAMSLEKNYSKEMILEAYLNTLRLTGQIAGVQSGANTYFGKNVKDLSIAQCASIAAITKNPSTYNPYLHPEEHLERRDYIIGLMYEQGMITQEQETAALAEPLGLADTVQSSSGGRNDWFTDYVIEEVISDLMEKYNYSAKEAQALLYNGGLRIYTTVVPSLQTAMENVMEEGEMFTGRTHIIPGTDENGNAIEVEESSQAAMVSLSYDGGVAALVGGVGEKTVDRGLNRAAVPRQVGSTMKPIAAYALGIEYGYVTMTTSIMDSPLKQIMDDETKKMRDWPANYSQEYSEKSVLVTDAIARSLNTIAVKVGQMVGVRTMYDFLEGTLGLEYLVPSGASNDMDLGPLVLGSLTEGITPIELASAYMMFGNNGYHYEPHCYTSVETASGDVLLEKNITRTQAISDTTANIMLKCLDGVLHSDIGTGSGLGTARMASVGKTGTTSDNRDHWFVGLTPYYVTATWWGYDHPDTLVKFSYATHPPTTAWRAVMNAAQADLEYKNFPTCNNVVELRYCKESGDLATPSCPETAIGYYKEDKQPGTCILHG